MSAHQVQQKHSQFNKLTFTRMYIGTIPGVFISEAMVNHVAKALSLDVEDVKRKNLYQKGQVGLPDHFHIGVSMFHQLL